jgi:hypothetical protein
MIGEGLLATELKRFTVIAEIIVDAENCYWAETIIHRALATAGNAIHDYGLDVEDF